MFGHQEALGEYSGRSYMFQAVFRTNGHPPPLHVATALDAFNSSFPKPSDVEHWAAGGDDIDAHKSLLKLGHLASDFTKHADSASLAHTLVATERQQIAFDSVWPRVVDQDIGNWVCKLPTNGSAQHRRYWWIRTPDEDYINGDTHLKAAQKDRVENVLLPFISNWRASSQAHAKSNMPCRHCSGA
ncbi:hypothetical protein GGR57DRAFT_497935 [Xylariaceae sp. FL1272]|nr:hypothetical protein GGR57DRAFT_497935 [Xylariaceae sp. FL1272]